ncbi:MAG: lysoplasmalogenase [Dyella sp.]
MSAIVQPFAPEASRYWLGLGLFIVAVGAIAGAELEGAGHWLHWLCKPVATGLILLLAWRALPAVSTRYRRWVMAGIGVSLLGDIWLMLPGDFFVLGLLSFLCAHGCFIAALLSDTRWNAQPLALALCLGYAALAVTVIWPGLGSSLHLPVIVYVLVLATMAGLALTRALVYRHTLMARPAALAAAGALIFLLSDSLLAWHRFRAPLPWSALWVLTTYYYALWLLAASVRRRRCCPSLVDRTP